MSGAQRPQFEAFAREYFRRLDADDLAERTPEDLCGALLSHWQFGAARVPGRPKVRVLSPTVAEDGWASRHSVIEIVNDDMPFLVDSTTMEINRQGLTLHLIVHPIFAVERDADGRLASIRLAQRRAAMPRANRGCTSRSTAWSTRSSAPTWSPASSACSATCAPPCEDWKPMVARLHEAIAELDAAPASLPPAQVAESRAFLRMAGRRPPDPARLPAARPGRPTTATTRCDWCPAAASACLRETAAEKIVGQLRRVAAECTRAGAMRLAGAGGDQGQHPLDRAPPGLHRLHRRQALQRAGRGHRRAPLPRPVHVHRLQRARVRDAAAARQGRGDRRARRPAPGGHLAKALDHILETYPRDELFQISDDELYETALGILALGERQRLRLFVRRDPFDRFVSCLVYVPREAYSTDLRMSSSSASCSRPSPAPAPTSTCSSATPLLARIHFTVRTTPGQVPAFDRKELESQLADAARRWDDELRDALIDAEGEARGIELFKRWSGAFPPDYRERVAARGAVPDVRKIASR